jgi:hypothetical protein
VLLLALGLTLSVVSAQSVNQLKLGDPPVTALITVSPADANGLVTIVGAAGAVFPAAQVAVRNLYTGDTVYTQAGITGTFSAQLYGPGNTPFWISPSKSIPTQDRNNVTALPGGPGTVIYGPFTQTEEPAEAVTRIAIDGDLSDWAAYPDALLTQEDTKAYGLFNRDSLYIGLDAGNVPDYEHVEIAFNLNTTDYILSLDPRQPKLASLVQTRPEPPRDLGTLGVATAGTNMMEFRIPLVTINQAKLESQTVILGEVRFVAKDGASVLKISASKPAARVDERDGIFHLKSGLNDKVSRFTLSGSLAGGASHWNARGRINSLSFKPGDTLALQLDVTMDTPDLPDGLVGLHMLGDLGLLPLVGADGSQAAGGLDANNGWSNVLTPGGLAISGLRGDFKLAQAAVPAPQIIRRNGKLLFALDFTVKLPDDLPDGLYIPYFQGSLQVVDGDIFRWQDPNPLAKPVRGGVTAAPVHTRLPLVVNVGAVTKPHLVWTLFQDDPSDGSRGLLSQEDQKRYALSNRVRFNSATYILPPFAGATKTPIAYPIEPYLLNQMPNREDRTAPPLAPFQFPGGRLNARITRPDGQVDDLGSPSILQSRLSTDLPDEAVLFGRESQVDVYRLTTLNKAFGDYVFQQYGDYKIELNGNLEDVWGNSYEGGGTYNVLIAEPMRILPGALPGTPYEVGNPFNPSLRLSPGAPAEVTITVRIYSLDGGAPTETVIKGQANRDGYFQTAQSFRFDAPGEYVIDYEARYTDSDKRLWAGSLRSAGVIANPGGKLIAHGQRGLDNYASDLRPAWFSAAQYAPGVNQPRFSYPYHVGDVVWINADITAQLQPIIQAQDSGGAYSKWLLQNTSENSTIAHQAAEGELPLGFVNPPAMPYSPALNPAKAVNQAYSYISAVRPGITTRQFVQGGDGDVLNYWDMDDPNNGQAGAGTDGNRPNDYLFLFGGLVARNADAGVRDSAIYAALAVMINPPNDTLGPRVYPPYRGEAGGPNGGPLMIVGDQPINMFFYPAGVQPGQVLTPGDTFTVAGQVAPTLPSIVAVTITSPAGKVREFTGTANAIGYFYDPTQDFPADEEGIWTVQIKVRHEGKTSAGQIEPPPPAGGILGTIDGRYNVYVVPKDKESLQWNDTRLDLAIPAGIPYNFNFPLPADWKDVHVFHTLTVPGLIIEDGPIRPSGSSFSYQFNPANLSGVSPTLETTGQGDGARASDVVTLTLFASGVDGAGRVQVRSRSFTIAHDRLTTFN